MKTSEILIAGKALIADPAKWIQGAYATRPILPNELVNPELVIKGDRVHVFGNDPAATCWCSIGTLQHVVNTMNANGEKNAQFYLTRAVSRVGDTTACIQRYNDSHTHDEVMRVWDIAIELALKDEA